MVGDQDHLLRQVADPGGAWAMLTCDPMAVRLNGTPLLAGIAVLADRDEIRVANRIAWFSVETRPVVEPYPVTAAAGSCPRCKQTIAFSTPAVRCPSCGLWHHASDDLPCWSYAATCAVCNQPTAADMPLRWSPEEL